MNFLLSQEQVEIQRAIAGFLSKSCPSTTLHEIYDREEPYEPSIWQGLIELGVGALIVPEAFGGLGMEMIDLALISEVLGANAAPVPLLGHALVTLAIMHGGSDDQKANWLPKLAAGEVVATVAFDEGGQTWLPEQWRLSSSTRLSGRKRFVPHGMQANLILVGLSGGGFALVDASAEGLSRCAQDGIDRTRPVAEFVFDQVVADPLPGAEGLAEKVRDAALVLLAADSFGGASRAVESAVSYATIREQFGQPIGRFQGLKHQLVNTAVEVEPSRGLYWFAAHAFDHIAGKAEHAAALAKAHLCDRYLQTARDTVEAHGGIGYTWECDVQIYVKRAMFNFAFMGQPAVHFDRAADLAGW
ncbi:acyl-CoA/acyl-ACP dehydrogenase [Spongiibacter sp. KMU-166]|uniref:Acyl-CoA/acyl-ACP dehydrogenase n=1 Tax=Spongiibacter thalassae TaxID=2721624 RepID=A0ABX1GAJ6_9GAMM|nr:acyl-CoA dehydrogenase family protein [Spongiibacter thalassae]NKI15971.1 acyl-CoA/acyl-ACP dehydrogenase [Spongiibacter thalassae]